MFKGDPLEWQGFWDRFQASIHNNISLADIHRFSYLKSNLKGEALAAISDLSLNSENYTQAVAILKERYGNEQVLILAHMESLGCVRTLEKVMEYFNNELRAQENCALCICEGRSAR